MVDFDVTLRVSSARLATVLEALNGSATLVSVLPCTEVTPKRARVFAYAGGKRNKGISGQQLVLQALQRANGKLTIGQLGKIFAAQGFSPNSQSPALAALKTRGLVESLEKGSWKLTPAGLKEVVV